MSLHSCSNNVSKKDAEVYCKLLLFSDFWNKLLLATVQKWKVILQFLATGGKRWWSNSVVTCEQLRWKLEEFKRTNVTI